MKDVLKEQQLLSVYDNFFNFPKMSNVRLCLQNVSQKISCRYLLSSQ